MNNQAVNWLNAQPMFTELPELDRQEVGSFTFLYTMYESYALDFLSQLKKNVCDANGTRKTLAKSLIRELVQNLPPQVVPELHKEYIYFERRFTEGVGMSAHWDSAGFRERQDGKEELEQYLTQPDTSPELEAEVVMRIVYRLRNNLFHGYKWAYGLRGQQKNFENANSALVKVLNAVMPK